MPIFEALCGTNLFAIVVVLEEEMVMKGGVNLLCQKGVACLAFGGRAFESQDEQAPSRMQQSL